MIFEGMSGHSGDLHRGSSSSDSLLSTLKTEYSSISHRALLERFLAPSESFFRILEQVGFVIEQNEVLEDRKCISIENTVKT
jgi:hypothetical protein